MDTAFVESVRAALSSQDPEAFGALLAPGATWGDPNDPRGCASRDDILEMLRAGAASGATAEVAECVGGDDAVLVVLDVRWPRRGTGPLERRRVVQLYEVAGGRIVRVEGYEDRDTAAAAAGLPS